MTGNGKRKWVDQGHQVGLPRNIREHTLQTGGGGLLDLLGQMNCHHVKQLFNTAAIDPVDGARMDIAIVVCVTEGRLSQLVTAEPGFKRRHGDLRIVTTGSDVV